MRRLLIVPNFILWCFFFAVVLFPALIIDKIREGNKLLKQIDDIIIPE